MTSFDLGFVAIPLLLFVDLYVVMWFCSGDFPKRALVKTEGYDYAFLCVSSSHCCFEIINHIPANVIRLLDLNRIAFKGVTANATDVFSEREKTVM